MYPARTPVPPINAPFAIPGSAAFAPLAISFTFATGFIIAAALAASLVFLNLIDAGAPPVELTPKPAFAVFLFANF